MLRYWISVSSTGSKSRKNDTFWNRVVLKFASQFGVWCIRDGLDPSNADWHSLDALRWVYVVFAYIKMYFKSRNREY